MMKGKRSVHCCVLTYCERNLSCTVTFCVMIHCNSMRVDEAHTHKCEVCSSTCCTPPFPVIIINRSKTKMASDVGRDFVIWRQVTASPYPLPVNTNGNPMKF